MYLKRLEIYGFKSFGAKSILDFEHQNKVSNIAAIVGPNGSGKSNVADAVRWVLGEQSGKLLRSKKNEDVIFCGSSSKSRSSYSEVAITLSSNEPVEVEINNKKFTFSDIEVARKLYRSGESEYLINKKKVRLLDVQQLLATLGFGQSSYTVIGQGMVDRLLFFNAAERKVLFDEAAGVKQYEIKREQAIRKLEGTDANLIRLKDILFELEPRVVNLRRLVKRAEGRKEIEEELCSLQSKYFLSVEKDLTEKIEFFKDSKKELNNKIVLLEKEIKSLENEVEKISSSNSFANELSELEKAINTATIERDGLMQKVISLEAFITQAEGRSQSNKAEKQRLEKDRESLSEKIDFLARKINEEKDSLQAEEKEISNLNNEIGLLETKRESLNKKMTTVESDSNAEEIKKLENQASDLEAKRREVSSELFSLQQQKSSWENEQKQKTERLGNLKNQLLKVEEEIDDLRSEESKAVKLKGETEKEQKLVGEAAKKVILEIEKIEKELSEIKKQVDQAQIEAFEKEVAVVFDEYKLLEGEIANSKGADLQQKLSGFFKSIENVFGKVKKITQALNKNEQNKIESNLKKLQNENRSLEEKAHRLAIDFERVVLVIERIKERLEGEKEKKDRLEAELRDLEQATNRALNEGQIESLNIELGKINTEIQKLEIEVKEKNKGISEKKHEILAEKNKLHEEEARLRRKIYEVELALNRKRNTIENQENELQTTSTRIESIERRILELSDIQDDQNKDKAKDLEQNKKDLESKNQLLASLRQKLSEVMSKQRESGQVTLDIERKRRSQESELLEVRNKINQLELEEVKYATRLEDLHEELKVSEIKLDRAIKVEKLDQASKDSLRIKIENLKRRLETIGSVDPETVAEYEELDNRNKEMSEQVADLENAKGDLEKIIKELDVKIKKQFSEVFSSIATEFNRYFQILFEGGKATLTLGEDEEGNFGIEITANPPGKKVQSLSALSGGERTLTSLALVFAILSINPSPFCVLDEVDAALDEANTLRFARILKDLDEKTQFVVISHNRETMKVADTLYGITMDQDHISKMISVRLTEALETVKV